MSSLADEQVILYYYEVSPFSKRITSYLALRGIKYKQCLQPRVMPRPDLARLGVKYRRIPVLAIGRDVYLDSRLILEKLEQLAPEKPRLGAESTPEHRAIQRLLSTFVMDGGFVKNVVISAVSGSPILQNEAWTKDRGEMIGTDAFFRQGVIDQLLPDALNEVRNGFDLLETTLLADGREWILKTERPTIADIEAVWSLNWFVGAPGGLPETLISAALFPLVFAWIGRFKQAVTTAQESLGEIETLSGEAAAQLVFGSNYHEEEGNIDETDPVVQHQSLTKGQQVQVWPTDSGTAHKELGELLSVTAKEVVIQTKTDDGSVRIHTQRHGFAVKAFNQ